MLIMCVVEFMHACHKKSPFQANHESFPSSQKLTIRYILIHVLTAKEYRQIIQEMSYMVFRMVMVESKVESAAYEISDWDQTFSQNL